MKLKQEDKLKAVDAALMAGKVILEVYNDPAADFQVERKADHSPLTIADRRAHEVIVSYLQETPYPVLSEEGKHLPYETRAQWQTLWIVDPLDGTKEFIKQNGEFTVNIALVDNGVPVFGVIYVPVKGILYWGVCGEGAYKMEGITDRKALSWDELQQQASRLPLTGTEREAFVLVASRSHLSAETEAYIQEKQREHACVDLVSVGSSIKICWVAEGIADEYPRFAPTMEWDTAAGHAIAKASGAEVWRTDMEIPLSYNKSDLLNPWFIVKRNK